MPPTPIPASDDFDTIFGGIDDDAVKSKLAISPPRTRSASTVKTSMSTSSSESVGKRDDMASRTQDLVDYELESGEEVMEEGETDASQPMQEIFGAPGKLDKLGYGSFIGERTPTKNSSSSSSQSKLESVCVPKLFKSFFLIF